MSAKVIVFATDFSSASDAGLDYASRLAKERGDKLLIVHVEEPPFAYGGGDLYYGVPEPDSSALARMLGELKPTQQGVEYEHRLLVGAPATELVRLAAEVDAEFIVIGSHGRRGVSRLILGSVAEAVMRSATCPVLVLKHPRGGKP